MIHDRPPLLRRSHLHSPLRLNPKSPTFLSHHARSSGSPSPASPLDFSHRPSSLTPHSPPQSLPSSPSPSADTSSEARLLGFSHGHPAIAAMREPSTRTKVVVRRLPPALPESAFMEQIATRFSDSINWIVFFPGKSSAKGSIYSRAYIDFKHGDGVIEFHQEFNGHIFVNEKGTQYKAVVEYAPNQRVPKLWTKKDAREGAILQDPEYLKFVEMLSKPVEYLPSAEVQLERKEAERNSNLAAGMKDSVIVTPLMEFVRHKRALKSNPQKLLAGSGKITVRGASPTSSRKMIAKRGSERSRTSGGFSPASRLKEKQTYVPRSEEKKTQVIIEAKEKKPLHEASRKSGSNASITDNGAEQSRIQLLVAGKKDVVLGNQGDEDESNALSSKSSQQRFDNSGRLSKGGTSSKTPVLLQKSDQQSDKDKRLMRSQLWRSNVKESNNASAEGELSSSQQQSVSTGSTEDRSDASRQDGRRLRNKDRPDRPVWTVRRREVSSSADSPTSFTAVPSLSPTGSQRQGKGPREFDNSAVTESTRPTNKRVGGHEKQVWVAKPGSGS